MSKAPAEGATRPALRHALTTATHPAWVAEPRHAIRARHASAGLAVGSASASARGQLSAATPTPGSPALTTPSAPFVSKACSVAAPADACCQRLADAHVLTACVLLAAMGGSNLVAADTHPAHSAARRQSKRKMVAGAARARVLLQHVRVSRSRHFARRSRVGEVSTEPERAEATGREREESQGEHRRRRRRRRRRLRRRR